MLRAIKEKSDSNTLTVGDLNALLIATDRSFRQKISEEIQALNDILDKIDLISIYRTFHLKPEEYTFFSSAHETFSRIEHMVGHNASPGKFKKIEIISSIFIDHNAIRLEINDKKKKKTAKNTNMWRLNNILLNKPWITKEIKEEILKMPRDK